MTENKLSNLTRLNTLAENVPNQIDSYTYRAFEEFRNIGKKSVYYSQMTVIGMISCVILLIVGSVLIFMGPSLKEKVKDIFLVSNQRRVEDEWDELMNAYGVNSDVRQAEAAENEEQDVSDYDELLNLVEPLTMLLGVITVLIAIHGIGKMIFSQKADSTDSQIGRLSEKFKKQFHDEIQRKPICMLIEEIDGGGDLVLDEVSALDGKLNRSVSGVRSRNKVFSVLTLISRIIIPLLLLVGVFWLIKKGQVFGWTRFTIAFVLMFIFNVRFCNLMEYKVNALIRTVMCLPSLAYTAFVALTIWNEYELETAIRSKFHFSLPEFKGREEYLVFVVCAGIALLFQMIVLILSVTFRNFLGERLCFREGVAKRNPEKKPHSKWYTIYGIVVCFASMVVMIMIIPSIKLIGLGSLKMAMMMGTSIMGIMVLMGIIWRLVSPFWPVSISKNITRFWVYRFSFVIEMFFNTLLYSSILGIRPFDKGNMIGLYLIFLVVSWISFAIMVPIGRSINK
jgi:hypothetical protein